MSQIANFIPNPFGGFAPFPNSIMIPFMGTQSKVLGYDFGLGYEIGKRTIKALPNDFFNKIVSQNSDEITVVRNGQDIVMQYKDYISFITKEFHNQTLQEFTDLIPNALALQDTIISASVAIELKKAERTPSAFVEILQAFQGATQTEVGEKLDALPQVEKDFILNINAFVAVIYSMYLLDKNATSPEPTPPKLLDCEAGYNWAIPITSSDPTDFDVVSIKFAYEIHNLDGTITPSDIVDFAWPYATHMLNIVNFENFIQNSDNLATDRVTATNILTEYKKGMLANYHPCGTAA